MPPPVVARPPAGPQVSPQQRQQFLNLCSQANTKVDLAERQFSAWLSSITIAYSQAWTAHTNFLKAQDQTARLGNELLLGVALAFVPGGIGGVIGDSMKKLGGGVALVDGTKDLAKWGLRSGAVVGQPGAMTITIPGFKAFPTDPLVWSNHVNQRVQTELATVTRIIENWQNMVNTNNPGFLPTFNPVEKVEAALVLSPNGGAAAPLSSLQPVKIPELQQNFEAGMLTAWIDANAFKAWAGTSPAFWNGIISDGIEGEFVKYGSSIGVKDTKKRLSEAISKGVQDNNERARRSGHGLI